MNMVRDFSLYFLQIRHRLGRGYEVEERLRTMAAPDQRRGRGPRHQLEELKGRHRSTNDAQAGSTDKAAIMLQHDSTNGPPSSLDIIYVITVMREGIWLITYI